MTYRKLFWISFLGFFLTALPESIFFSYLILLSTLGVVVYFRYANRKQLKEQTGFFNLIARLLAYFLFGILSLTLFILPDVKNQENSDLDESSSAVEIETLSWNGISFLQEEVGVGTEISEPSAESPTELSAETSSPNSQPSAQIPPLQPQPEPTAPTPEISSYPTYTLLKVVDGDTIKIKDNNHKELSVRMIGLDAPESSTTRYGYMECFGHEATAHLKSLVGSASQIQLETDETQTTTDKYGRLLGYVLVNGINLNQQMIEDGYAFEYTYNLPYKYQSQFKQAQKNASEQKRGLRADTACQGDRKKGVASPSKPQDPQSNTQDIGEGAQTQSNSSVTTTPSREYHRWPKGGCYYYTAKGKKEYVDRSLCN